MRRRWSGHVCDENAGGGRGSDGQRHGVHQEGLDVLGGGQIERSLVLLVLHRGIGAVSEQQRTQLSPTLLSGFVQRRE